MAILSAAGATGCGGIVGVSPGATGVMGCMGSTGIQGSTGFGWFGDLQSELPKAAQAENLALINEIYAELEKMWRESYSGPGSVSHDSGYREGLSLIMFDSYFTFRHQHATGRLNFILEETAYGGKDKSQFRSHDVAHYDLAQGIRIKHGPIQFGYPPLTKDDYEYFNSSFVWIPKSLPALKDLTFRMDAYIAKRIRQTSLGLIEDLNGDF